MQSSIIFETQLKFVLKHARTYTSGITDCVTLGITDCVTLLSVTYLAFQAFLLSCHILNGSFALTKRLLSLGQLRMET